MIVALNPTRIDTISTYDGAQPLKCNDIGLKIIKSSKVAFNKTFRYLKLHLLEAVK